MVTTSILTAANYDPTRNVIRSSIWCTMGKSVYIIPEDRKSIVTCGYIRGCGRDGPDTPIIP